MFLKQEKLEIGGFERKENYGPMEKYLHYFKKIL